MGYTFLYNGGVDSIPGGIRDFKFLVFPVFAGREYAFKEAMNIGLLKQRDYDQETKATRYFTDAQFIKVFSLEQEEKQPRYINSYYLRLGVHGDPQTVTIQPFCEKKRKQNWKVVAEARFMSQKEVLEVLTPGQMAHEMAKRMQMPPLDILKRMCSIQRPRHIEEAREVRKIRL